MDAELLAQEAIAAEKNALSIENRIMSDYPDVYALIQMQKKLNDNAAIFWDQLRDMMIDTNTTSLKGDYGTITLATRHTPRVDESLLPRKFFKKTPDNTKIMDQFKLTGTLPNGVSVQETKYLVKIIKEMK